MVAIRHHGMCRTFGVVLALLAAAAIVPAAAAPAIGECVGVTYDAKTPVMISRVAGPAPKTVFIRNTSDDPSCPADTAACRSRAYLVPGDLVLTGITQGALTCVTYQSLSPKGGVASGWIAAASLAPVAPVSQPSDWAGTWWVTGGKLTIKPARDGKLAIAGEHTYPVAGGVRSSEIEGVAKPAGDILGFAGDGDASLDQATEGTCQFRMQRVGALLVVEDNWQCGDGMVSFTGLYQRKR